MEECKWKYRQTRDIRKKVFIPSLREERQKNYDVNEYVLVDNEFEVAGKKRVYATANVSIFLTSKCNAACGFCVADLRYLNDNKCQVINSENPFTAKAKLKYSNWYLKRLESVLKKLHEFSLGRLSVSITGGEPTMSYMFNDVVDLVRKANFAVNTITTNDSKLLNKMDNGITPLELLLNQKYDYINISRPSHLEDENCRIMKYSDTSVSDYVNWSNEYLKEVISEIHHHGFTKERLSCALLKDSVHNVSGIKKYIDAYQKLGVNNFIFRQLMGFDKNSINAEVMNYCRKNMVMLDDIWKEMDNEEDFVKFMNLVGYYYYVEIYKYHGATVASEAANLITQYKEKAKNPDVVYEMVFHPNGNLCAGWIDDEEVLDGIPIIKGV